MSKICEVDYNEKYIKFDNLHENDLKGLILGKEYGFFDLELDKLIKVVKRGKDESTTYLLLDNEIKEILKPKFKEFFSKKTVIRLDSKIIDINKQKYLVARL